MIEKFPDDFQGGETPGLNFKKYFLRVLKRWPFILLLFLICLSLGYAVNRYSTPIYSVKGRITTKKYSGKQSSLVPGLVDASYFLGGITEVYEEIPILRSPKRIASAIDKIDFRVSYFSRGLLKTVEMAKGYGFTVNIDSLEEKGAPFGISFFVNHISELKFELFTENENWTPLVRGKKFQFGKPFKLGNSRLTIINTNGKTNEQNKYGFVINRRSDLINKYRSKLKIDWAMKGSAMLDLSMQSELPERDIEFMRAYYEVVHEFGLEEKNEQLDRTLQFIDEQMNLVKDSVNFYQSLMDGMKLENRKLILGSEQIYTRLDELDKKKADILLNERYLDYLTNYFRSNSQSEIFAPSLIGLDIPPLEGWVSQFMNSKLTAADVKNAENENNPLITRQDSINRRLIKNIYESVRTARERNASLMSDIDKQERILYESVNEVQQGSRELAKYERLYQINNKLFDLFINRRTEAAISKASATSDYKVIDEPAYSKTPIRPNGDMNLLIAAALGLLVPIGFLLIKDLTNGTIMDKDDLSVYLKMPLLGNIAHSDYETKLVVKEHPRSVVSESFRSIRANLKFISAGVETNSKTFLLTSSIGGEGKTFCSINLAYTLAVSQNKTILIAADLRKPVMATYLNIPLATGLSSYLAGVADMNDIIIEGGENEPDIIDAGPTPPNPSELLAGQRMGQLLAHLKEKYDYIIIDTAPIGLVADAMELFKYVDYKILIVRQSVTPKAALRMVNEQYIEGKIGNLTVLFNDLELIKRRGSMYGGYMYGMGYSGYGFGYYEEDTIKRGNKA